MILPIFYGYPSGKIIEKLSKGEVEIGGYIVTPNNPKCIAITVRMNENRA